MLVIYRDHLTLSPVSLVKIPLIDLCVFDFHSSCSTVPTRFILCYRPPNIPVSANVKFFDSLEDICSCPSPLVILGDFNLHLDWSDLSSASGQSVVLSQFSSALSLTQHVSQPTLGSHYLDIILSSDPSAISKCSVVAPFSSSDHSIFRPPSPFLHPYH